MRLHFVFVGKTSFPEVEKGISRYQERLAHHTRVQIHHVKAEKIRRNVSDHLIRQRECDRILELVGGKGYLIVWDERGKELDSVSFAHFLEHLQTQGISDVWMVIGGPLGIGKKLRERSQIVLSLSKMTFPHDLARLLVFEQVYRAFTIMRKEPYHK